MRHYEATIVLDPGLGEDGLSRHVERIKDAIKKQGGELLVEERWGMRTLAYQIQKRDQGYYVILEWEGPGELIAELDRILRLDENVLRHLIITLDPKELAVREEQRQRRAAGEGDRPRRGRDDDKDEDEISSDIDEDEDKDEISSDIDEDEDKDEDEDEDEDKDEDDLAPRAIPVVEEVLEDVQAPEEEESDEEAVEDDESDGEEAEEKEEA